MINLRMGDEDSVNIDWKSNQNMQGNFVIAVHNIYIYFLPDAE